MLVANHLGIPFQVMDLSAEYKERIVDYMFAEYAAGRTPNPDVSHREVKFDPFLDAALKLGADAVATGITADATQTTKVSTTSWQRNKDQSYFVSVEPGQAWPCPLPSENWKSRKSVRSQSSRLATAGRRTAKACASSARCVCPISCSNNSVARDIVEIPRDHAVFQRPEHPRSVVTALRLEA